MICMHALKGAGLGSEMIIKLIIIMTKGIDEGQIKTKSECLTSFDRVTHDSTPARLPCATVNSIMQR